LNAAVERASLLLDNVVEQTAANEALAAAGTPKPSGEALLTAADKAKLEREHDKRVQEVVGKQCLSVLKLLMAHKWGFPFNTPVDTVALGLTDYHKVHPIWISVLMPIDNTDIGLRVRVRVWAMVWVLRPYEHQRCAYLVSV